MRRLKEHRSFWLILVIYLVLAVAYSFATPPYEAPDESYHVGMIMYLMRTGTLPVQGGDHNTEQYGYFQEASQPPLYYVIQAQLIRWMDNGLRYFEGDYRKPGQNPYAAIGIGLAQVNQRVYDPAPFWDAALHYVFFQMRLFSTILGAITLGAIYSLARRVFMGAPKPKNSQPIEPAVLIAVAFVAFNPMFIFIHASVTNDTLATTLATVALAILFARKPSYWLLGIVLALGAITKLSALTLYPVVGGVLLIHWLRGELRSKDLLFNGFKIALCFAVIAAWWYVRNLQLYGELTGTTAMIATIGARKTPYTALDFLNEMQGLRISGWALFGWLNVIGPDWFLTLMDVLTAVALIGGIVAITRMIRARRWLELQPYGILAAYFLIIFVSLINWTRQTPGTQGRLLFPAMGAIAVLVALGWRTAFTLPERFPKVQRFALALPILPMVVVAALSPSLTIAPAYAPPPIVAEVPTEAAKHSAEFKTDRMEAAVLGVIVDADKSIHNAESLSLTFYYSMSGDSDISLFITIYDCQKKVIGKLDTTPGGGNLGLSVLYANNKFTQKPIIYKDHYSIPLHFQSSFCQPMIEIGWYETYLKKYLQTVDGKNALLLRGSLIWNEQTHPELPPQTIQKALYSGTIRLNGYTLPQTTVKAGDALPIRLNFESNARIYEDFTVFYHLLDADGKPLATGDAPPKNNDYPTTAWLPNLPFNDDKVLTIPPGTPPGTYRIAVGFYRPSDLTRLPVDVGGDAVILNTPIEVK